MTAEGEYPLPGPRACALPVADEAQAQCAPRSIKSRTSVSPKILSGTANGEGVAVGDGRGMAAEPT